jgi:hypothetical protein
LWQCPFNPLLSRWVRERDRYAPKIHLHETVEELRQFNSRYHIFSPIWNLKKNVENKKPLIVVSFFHPSRLIFFLKKGEVGVKVLFLCWFIIFYFEFVSIPRQEFSAQKAEFLELVKINVKQFFLQKLLLVQLLYQVLHFSVHWHQ